jgi:hypothetical protein
MDRKGLLLACYFDYLLDEQWDFTADAIYECNYYVEKEKHKKFPIAETYTVRNPRAVVVHVQHTSLACRAMMASKIEI